MRRTKILATLGPASTRPGVLEEMIEAGLDAVRLNFSHGSQEQHAAAYKRVRDASAKVGRAVAVLQDLQGPKIRIGKVKDGGMEVATGSTLTITSRKVEGEGGVVSTEYAALPRDVTPGLRILLDDGRIAVVVREVRGEDILCDVADGGVLSSHKGINVPGATLTAAAMTEKDRADARFGLALGVDFIALSFVRRASDVEDLRALMEAEGRRVPIVAKIEKPQAIENLDAIIDVAEGVMVARGDLAVEVSLEMIPAHQKLIIQRANRVGKLVITATQMLESMTENPLPTRAEVTDVANAVLDGTDAVMLSGETAVGKFPVETVRRMGAIARTTEEQLYPFARPVRPASPKEVPDFTAALARLAGEAARDVDPRAVVVFTRSGRTARRVSDERPRAPVLAFTPDPGVYNQLALYWGVVPRMAPERTSSAELLAEAGARIVGERWAEASEPVVVLFGTHTGEGATNSLRIAKAGELGAP
jgi:pyruvate kinase